MNSEDDTESNAEHGRRSTDNTENEGSVSSSYSSFRSKLLSGFLAIGGVTALIATGRASHVLDTAVINNIKQDAKIEKILDRLAVNDIEQNRLLVVLENQVQQQNRSDAEFLDELKETREKLNDIDHGVRQNRESIIMINPKMSAVDNTNVICMR
jgi:hypothetical protein